MAFDSPIPFDDALDELEAKELLPTALSSKGIREQWSADLRQRAIFSARTTKAGILQGYKDQVKDLLDGKVDIATARAKMQDMYDSLGYSPKSGFAASEEDDMIPPAEPGSLRDLSSNKRVDLVLQTNLRQVANFAFKEKGQTDQALFNYPCWELVRIYPRLVPRGEKLVKGEIVEDPGEDWPSRWESVGGEFYDGRMIARKDDDIWSELGDSGNFDDALDTDIPPFAFNSGYGWREVPRQECIDLGVIDDDTDIQGSSSEMNEGVEAAAKFDPEFLKALRDGLDVQIKDGIAKLKGGEQE